MPFRLVPQQEVGRDQIPRVAEVRGGDRVFRHGHDLPEMLVLHAFHGDDGQVPGRRIVVVFVQTAGIDEIRALASQFAGLRIHHDGKVIHAACDGLGDGDRTVVGTGDEHGVQHHVRVHDLPFPQFDAGTADVGRLRVHGDIALQIQVFQSQQRRHHLRRASREPLFIRVVFVQDLARGHIEQNGR